MSQPGSKAYDALQNAITALGAVDDDASGSSDEEMMSVTQPTSVGVLMEEEEEEDDVDLDDDDDALESEELSFHAAQREDDVEAWIAKCGRCADQGYKRSVRLELSTAEEFRCERECWSLLGAVLRLETDQQPAKKLGNGELQTAEDVTKQMRSTETAQRRRCVITWLERGALEKVRYFKESITDSAVDAGCVDGLVAAVALTASRGEDVQAAVATMLEAGLEVLKLAATDERDLVKAMSLLVRAGRRSEAASLAEARGAFWRASVLRGGGAWGDGGNVNIGLWRECCSSRAREALKVARACSSCRADVQQAVLTAARTKHALRSEAASRLATEALEATREAAFLDSAMHALLAGDKDLLAESGESASWEDGLWADLSCAEEKAVDAVVRALAREHANISDLYPKFTSPVVEEEEEEEDLGRILEANASRIDGSDTSCCLKRTQGILAMNGLASLPEGLLGPRGLLSTEYERMKQRGDRRSLLRLCRLCATVGLVARRLGCNGDSVDEWLAEYSLRLAYCDLSRLSPTYAAQLSQADNAVDCCAQCLALSVRFKKKQRGECIRSASAEFSPHALLKVGLRFAELVFQTSDADDAIAVFAWLREGLCGEEQLIQVISHGNALLRRFCGDALERGQEEWTKAEETMSEVFFEEALEACVDLARSRTYEGACAAAALKEILSWRALLKARALMDHWRSCLLNGADLDDAADRASRALETTLVFPGPELLARDRYGAAAKSTFASHAGDGELELWLETAATTLARYHRGRLPLGGWLRLMDDTQTLRSLVIPYCATALMEVTVRTADCFLDCEEDDLAKKWLRRSLKFAVTIARPAPSSVPLDDAEDFLAILSQRTVAEMLAKAKWATLELLRLAPPAEMSEQVNDAKFDWSTVLFD